MGCNIVMGDGRGKLQIRIGDLPKGIVEGHQVFDNVG
jgi:hypothetical protein